MKKLTVRELVATAVLLSLSVVLARFFVIYLTPALRINFGNIPIMIIGFMYGPIVGAAAGAMADIIGSTMLSALGWYPPLSLSAAAVGFIPGILALFFVKDLTDYKKVILSVFLTNIFGAMIIGTIVLSGMTHTPFFTLFPVRAGLYLGMSCVESLVICPVLRAIDGQRGVLPRDI